MTFKPSLYHILILPMILLLFPGCVGFQVRGDIQSGRVALLLGRSKLALAHFQRAAELDPHYVTDFTEFDQGVWTYVGRAYYQLGDLKNARRALERAREVYPGDHLAPIYLGLVLMRQGEKGEGFKEAGVGLRSLKVWLRDLDRYDRVGQYWDPGSVLESEIENTLAMMDGGDVRWQRIAPRLEWLGRRFEEEIDEAKKDEEEDLAEDDGGDSQK